ncbi:MAG: hypothetical protein EAX86_03505 [Candidatus Heimdallarchaeota archaeon]|nr:hypothetical protein [Candidatus Heimdallarchaeota archaeon]
MNSQGNLGLDISWKDHLPLLWKRKVRTFIKENPEYALHYFYNEYLKGERYKWNKFGLIQLLPSSFDLITNSIPLCSRENVSLIFELLSTPEFLIFIKKAKIESQHAILNLIISHLELVMTNKDIISKILTSINPDLSKQVYEKVKNSISNLNPSQIVLLFRLWGSSSPEIHSELLKAYLEDPFHIVKTFFYELKLIERIQIFKNVEDVIILSIKRFTRFLDLSGTSKQELSFITGIQKVTRKPYMKTLLKWFKEREVSLETLLEIHKGQKDSNINIFIIEYVNMKIKEDSGNIQIIFYTLVQYEELVIIHDLFDQLNKIKQTSVVKILLDLLNEENILSNLKLSNFLEEEISIYAKDDPVILLSFYLKSKGKSQKLLKPIVLENASNYWEDYCQVIYKNMELLSASVLSTLFSLSTRAIKEKIGNYILDREWTFELQGLFNDFDIFRPILYSPRSLTVRERTILNPYLKIHLDSNFEEILSKGNKFAFQTEDLASNLSSEHYSILVNRCFTTTEFLEKWRSLLLLSSKDVIWPIVRNYSSEKASSRSKQLIEGFFPEILQIELDEFWRIFRKSNLNSLSTFSVLINQAFNMSIPNVTEILQGIPETHLEFLMESIIPKFVGAGPRIIYSAFSFTDRYPVKDSIRERFLLEFTKLNREKFLQLVIIRISKIIIIPESQSFALTLLNSFFTHYELDVLRIIDKNQLSTLIQETKGYIQSLSQNDSLQLITNLLPQLKTDLLIFTLTEQLIGLVRNPSLSTKVMTEIFQIYESSTDFPEPGSKLIKIFLEKVTGRTTQNDLSIYNLLIKFKLVRAKFLISFFVNVPNTTIEKILFNLDMLPIENDILDILTQYYLDNPPDTPDKYFYELYQKSKDRKDIQHMLIPLLGRYYSWKNLKLLMNLPEKQIHLSVYKQALDIFASRFNIQSGEALEQIWNAGLKDVYSEEKPAVEIKKLNQSKCPQCENPILEDQKNCGFCSQRLTCVVCRTSVVKLQNKEEIVRCPQCGSFFHRKHLLESLKLKKNCPVCHMKLDVIDVLNFPNYWFSFH